MAKRKYVKRKEAYEQFGVNVRLGALTAFSAVSEVYVAQALGGSRPSERVDAALACIDEAMEYLQTARQTLLTLKGRA